MRLVPTVQAGVVCFILLKGGAAYAQVVTQNLSALGTPTQDATIDPAQSDTLQRYIAQGFRNGPWALHGDGGIAFGGTNNANRLAGGHKSSLVDATGNLNAQLQQSRREVNLGLSVDSLTYPEYTRQNRTNWSAILGGHQDLGEERLSFLYQHNKLTQMPTDLGALAINEPTPYTVDTGDLNLLLPTHGHLSFVPDFRVLRYDFTNPANPNIYTLQSYRDRSVFNEALALRYATTGSNAALAVFQDTQIRYANDLLHIPSRNSTGYAALAGYDWADPGPWRARGLIGYQHRTYAASIYKPIGTVYAELSGQWTPTHLTQISFGASRGITDGSFEGVVGFVYTSGSVRVRHLFARDLALSAGVTIQHGKTGASSAALRGTPLYTQAMSQLSAILDAEAEWAINRHMTFDLRNDFQNANANSDNSRRYNIEVLTLSFQYHL